MTRKEFKAIRRKHGIPPGSTVITVEQPPCVMVVRDVVTGRCAYLTPEKRCSIYEDRPKICRLYNDHPLMPCSYCKPGAFVNGAPRLTALNALQERRI